MVSRASRCQYGKGSKTYGLCVLCGDRVRNREEFIIASEGYCHQECLSGVI